ncbi:Gfo/Idh/MocA family oxidoreductase [Haloprofundus halobius]|uniref:Gfo/Idh/MocA family protein n=1 Tax=Haloprofundus halobius TaxID=2876194 RepID=UPI00295E47EF|nr:Gfo/Idh/MocA family oxidoreductase [Haloprofundus halobius]
MIQVGVGLQGSRWCKQYLPPNVEDGLVDVVAAVDVDPNAFEPAREHLGIDEDRCYTELERAFAEHDADFCSVVVPPHVHEDVVDLALEHEMDILSEKPIADTMTASARIAEKVERAGRKMGVTMTHRFDRDKTSLRRELRSGRGGPLDYLTFRFTCDYRHRGTWDERLYDIDDPLLMDGAVHHLDLLRDLAGSDPETVYTQSWNPPWSEFENGAQALATVTFENGVRAQYEAATTNAVGLNGWGHEYVRAESRDATTVLDHRTLERFERDPDDENWVGRHPAGEELPLLDREKWGNAWLVEQFVEWLDGGEPMATNVSENLTSMALVFGAIESAERGEPVDVREYLDAARADARDSGE